MSRKGTTWTPTEEMRRKMSEAAKRSYANGRIHWKTGKKGLPGPMKGRHHTEETKAKISEHRKGKCLGNTQGFAKGMEPHNKGKPHPVHTEEWRRKVSAAHSGERHWNWKGGINSQNRLMRNSTQHKEWAAAVRQRDGWTCRGCGYKGRLLVAHHILPWSLWPSARFDVSNGITLCRDCHCVLHRPRKGTGKPPKPQSV